MKRHRLKISWDARLASVPLSNYVEQVGTVTVASIESDNLNDEINRIL